MTTGYLALQADERRERRRRRRQLALCFVIGVVLGFGVPAAGGALGRVWRACSCACGGAP